MARPEPFTVQPFVKGVPALAVKAYAITLTVLKVLIVLTQAPLLTVPEDRPVMVIVVGVVLEFNVDVVKVPVPDAKVIEAVLPVAVVPPVRL
jgi:hypothetical protein